MFGNHPAPVAECPALRDHDRQRLALPLKSIVHSMIARMHWGSFRILAVTKNAGTSLPTADIASGQLMIAGLQEFTQLLLSRQSVFDISAVHPRVLPGFIRP